MAILNKVLRKICILHILFFTSCTYTFTTNTSFGTCLPINIQNNYFQDPFNILGTPLRMLNGVSSLLNSLLPHNNYYNNIIQTLPLDAQLTFDYIVVGGGAAGCPLAFTLAEAGYSTLLLERGPSRFEKTAQDTLDIQHLARPIVNEHLSQKIKTPQGILTHVAHVMGGGTSINLAIYVEETEEYFDYLSTFPNVDIDKQLFKNASDWIFNRVANKMPQNDTFNKEWVAGLHRLGFKPYHNESSNLQPTNSSSKVVYNDYSRTIQKNHMWGGYSLFNSSANYFRHAADTLLYNEQGKLPDTLHIITNHEAKKIIFEDNQNNKYAKCVEFTRFKKSKDKKEETDGLISLLRNTIVDLFQFVVNPTNLFTKLFYPDRNYAVYHACLNSNGGEIIMSSGAVMSPVLLFNSGVGPAHQIRELDIPLVHEIPNLGNNFSDRVFVPAVMFFKQPVPIEGSFPGKVSSGIAMKEVGSNCTNFTFNMETFDCTQVTVEEFSGSIIGQHVLHASRFPFPPAWRDHPILDLFFESLLSCSQGQVPYNSLLLSPLCKAISPISSCLKQATAIFYLTAEPKSRGYVHVNKKGKLTVNPNYMSHDQDLYDAIRGTAEIVNLVNGDEFKPSMEKYSRDTSCPAKIYNSLFEMIISLTSELNANAVGLSSFFEVRSLFQKETYENFHKRREQLQIQQQEFLERRLQDFNTSDFNFTQKTNSTKQETFNTITNQDEFGHILTSIEKALLETSSYSANGKSLKIDQDELNYRMLGLQDITDKQWAASFPPRLPNANDPADLARYVLSYMSSIWHHSGTAQLGDIVDSQFRVKGVEGLSIVDASVLNQMTRLNPTATIMSMGRYAGSLKCNSRNTPHK